MSFGIGDQDLYPLVGRRNGLRVLGALAGKRGATYGELLSQFKVSTATMSGTLKSLERADYVTRKKYGNRSFYSVTEKGKQALEEFYDEKRAIDHVADLVMQRVQRMGLAETSKEEVRTIVDIEVRSFFAGLDAKLQRRGSQRPRRK